MSKINPDHEELTKHGKKKQIHLNPSLHDPQKYNCDKRLHGHILYIEYAHCCYLENENYYGEEGRNGGKNWYSGGTTPLAGLIIRERDIEKAISDSGNHNLPEVELENIDVCVCVFV